ncbi:DUF397 domain-containing protein [Streptomyces sp. SAS_281]|uniref:DUF397 domain-containing protein n=1 Tax=Streptomyces sp. SAS_281 TaxID=3412744 RepID=UPI00403C6809
MNRGTSAQGDFELAWVKSSYSSNGNEGDCIEVAAAPAVVLVRDSKDIHRPHLAHPPRAWAAFVAYAARPA